MLARTGTWLAIVAGSAFGAFAALIGGSAEEKAEVYRPPPQVTRLPSSTPDAALSATPRVTEAALDAAVAPASSVMAVTDAAPASTASVTAAAMSAPQVVSEIASAKELKIAEIRCDSKDAEACVRAAQAYQFGGVVPQNLAQAERFRRLSRTAYVVQCDRGVHNACLALVRMYEAGDGVEKNPKLVEGFSISLRGLCTIRDAEACRALPAK